jgi:beta-glucosidase
VLLNNDSIFYGFWHTGFADVIIAVMGNNRLLEGEEGDAMLNLKGGDRPNIEFPDNQLDYLRKLRERIGKKKLVVVVTGGSAIAMPEVEKLADALLFAWYPGEEGGNALARILFGDVNPSGRLPVTFYMSTDDLPPFDDYSMAGRTYRYYNGQVQFPFGYGLSYTTFEYDQLKISHHQSAGRTELTAAVHIKNSGTRDGEEVIQVYIKHPDTGKRNPLKTLTAFKRVYLSAGESKNVSIPISLDFMQRWDVEKQEYVLLPGTYEIMLGASSADVRLSASIGIP